MGDGPGDGQSERVAGLSGTHMTLDSLKTASTANTEYGFQEAIGLKHNGTENLSVASRNPYSVLAGRDAHDSLKTADGDRNAELSSANKSFADRRVTGDPSCSSP
jgi:hypothetical protein